MAGPSPASSPYHYPRRPSIPPDPPASPRGILRQPPPHDLKRHSLPTTSPRLPHHLQQQHHTPRERFSSLQHSYLPSSTSTSSSISNNSTTSSADHINAYERDRVARASGQTPSPLLPLSSSPPSPRSPPTAHPHAHPRHAPHKPAPLPPRMPKPHPQHFLRRLEPLLRPLKMRTVDQLDAEDVMEIYASDLALGEQRERGGGMEGGKASGSGTKNMRVFGVPLRDVALYASSTTILGGYLHDLPLVVFACVEELYRTGIYQHGLFRTLPNRERHMELIRRFDTPTPTSSSSSTPTSTSTSTFGSRAPGGGFSLRAESTPDICALLSTYLSSLPETVLPVAFYGALWVWCVKPSLLREEQQREREEWEEEEARERRWGSSASNNASKSTKKDKDKHRPSPLPPPPPSQSTHDLPTLESPQIAIAQILLRLLPSANFSLLVYLCAFFTQIPLCPENGLTLADVAQIFGQTLVGGGKREAGRVMVWVLTRWWRISEGLVGGEEGSPTAAAPAGRRDASPPDGAMFEEPRSARREASPTFEEPFIQRASALSRKRTVSPPAGATAFEEPFRRRERSPTVAAPAPAGRRDVSPPDGAMFEEPRSPPTFEEPFSQRRERERDDHASPLSRKRTVSPSAGAGNGATFEEPYRRREREREREISPRTREREAEPVQRKRSAHTSAVDPDVRASRPGSPLSSEPSGDSAQAGEASEDREDGEYGERVLEDADKMSFVSDSASVYSTATATVTEPEAASSVLTSLNRIIVVKDAGISQAHALLAEARTRILQLERALERKEVVVSDARAQTFRAREEARGLAAVLEETKRARDGRTRGEGWREDWEREVGGRQVEVEGGSAERDKARGLVEDIRKLLEAT